MPTSLPGIIIILGSPNSKEGELYPVAKQRCDKGIQEHTKNPSWKIILTGGFGKHFNESDKPHTYYMQKYLIKKGIAPEAILDQVKSSNTLEDASLSRPIIMKYNVGSILVVTSDFHYDRARYIFEREYSGLKTSINFSLCTTDERRHTKNIPSES